MRTKHDFIYYIITKAYCSMFCYTAECMKRQKKRNLSEWYVLFFSFKYLLKLRDNQFNSNVILFESLFVINL